MNRRRNSPPANAVDGKPETGWGLSGRQNRNVHAVFLAETPFSVGDAGRIRFRLKYESQHAKHQMGRFRLSLTENPFHEPVGAYANLQEWHVIGPFAAEHPSAALRRAFPPENEAVNLGKAYKNAGKDLRWEKKADWDDQLELAASEKPAVSYFYRNIRSDASQRVAVSIETDGYFKALLNQQELVRRLLRINLPRVCPSLPSAAPPRRQRPDRQNRASRGENRRGRRN